MLQRECNGVGPLVRIKDRVDGEYYFRLIKENLKTPGFRDGSIIWQQDGAGKHRYAPLHQWFLKKTSKLLYGLPKVLI